MINKIQELALSLISIDKALHFIIGFFLFVLTNCFLSDIHSLIIVFVVALAKEIRDEFTYHGFARFIIYHCACYNFGFNIFVKTITNFIIWTASYSHWD
jgi:hypothetical protein